MKAKVIQIGTKMYNLVVSIMMLSLKEVGL